MNDAGAIFQFVLFGERMCYDDETVNHWIDACNLGPVTLPAHLREGGIRNRTGRERIQGFKEWGML